MHFEAREQAADVIPGGLERDPETLGDLVGVMSLREEPKHLLLPRRKRLAAVGRADVQRPEGEDHAENADDGVVLVNGARPNEDLNASAVAPPQLETLNRGRHAAQGARQARAARLVWVLRQDAEERVARANP